VSDMHDGDGEVPGGAPAAWPPKGLDGVMTNDEVGECAFARILMLGQPKIGKTTALLTSAPRPLIINCDAEDATKYANRNGAKYLQLDAYDRKTWKAAVQRAKKLAAEGVIKSIIVDSLTMLADNLLNEISVTLEGFDLWNEFDSQFRGGCKSVMKAEAHVFLVAHITPDYKERDDSAGIAPLIPGQSKVKLPAAVSDYVLFELDPTTGERQFLLGPQKSWNFSGRNVKRSCKVKATVPDLFGELGIAL
jgi:hypothetical protein